MIETSRRRRLERLIRGAEGRRDARRRAADEAERALDEARRPLEALRARRDGWRLSAATGGSSARLSWVLEACAALDRSIRDLRVLGDRRSAELQSRREALLEADRRVRALQQLLASWKESERTAAVADERAAQDDLSRVPWITGIGA